MPNYVSKLTLPTYVDNVLTNVEYTLKDAEARQMIEDLGKALYWIGITETELTDGSTTNPIVIATYTAVTPEAGDNPSSEGWYEVDATSATGYKLSEDTSVVPEKTYYERATESVTADVGGIASYNGLEFVFNGSIWQAFGHANFGSLAFKNTAEATYTPAGTIAITKGTDVTTSITPITAVGTLPSWTYNNEIATFVQGTLPTQGTSVDVVTESGTDTAAFTGTEATITVS